MTTRVYAHTRTFDNNPDTDTTPRPTERASERAHATHTADKDERKLT